MSTYHSSRTSKPIEEAMPDLSEYKSECHIFNLKRHNELDSIDFKSIKSTDDVFELSDYLPRPQLNFGAIYFVNKYRTDIRTRIDSLSEMERKSIDSCFPINVDAINAVREGKSKTTIANAGLGNISTLKTCQLLETFKDGGITDLGNDMMCSTLVSVDSQAIMEAISLHNPSKKSKKSTKNDVTNLSINGPIDNTLAEQSSTVGGINVTKLTDVFTSQQCKNLKNRVQNVDTYISTGLEETTTNCNVLEGLSYRHLIRNIITLSTVLKKGGSCILEISDTYTVVTWKLLRIITSLFGQVKMIKPLATPFTSSSKFIVATDYKPDESKIKFLCGLLDKLNAMTAFDTTVFLTDIIGQWELADVPEISEMNGKIVLSEYNRMNRLYAFIKKENFYGNEYHEYLKESATVIEKWVKDIL